MMTLAGKKMLGFWSCIFYSESAGLTEPASTLVIDYPDSVGSEIKGSNMTSLASERQDQRIGA